MLNCVDFRERAQLVIVTPQMKNIAFAYLISGIGFYPITHFDDPYLWDQGFRFLNVHVSEKLEAPDKNTASMCVELRDALEVADIKKLALIEFSLSV